MEMQRTKAVRGKKRESLSVISISRWSWPIHLVSANKFLSTASKTTISSNSVPNPPNLAKAMNSRDKEGCSGQIVFKRKAPKVEKSAKFPSRFWTPLHLKMTTTLICLTGDHRTIFLLVFLQVFTSGMLGTQRWWNYAIWVTPWSQELDGLRKTLILQLVVIPERFKFGILQRWRKFVHSSAIPIELEQLPGIQIFWALAQGIRQFSTEM